jgi:hypothetical protein
VTSKTTDLKTLNSLTLPLTSESTAGVSCETGNGGNHVQSAENSSQSQQNIGTSQQRDGLNMDDAAPATSQESSKKDGIGVYAGGKGTGERTRVDRKQVKTNNPRTPPRNTHPCCKPITLTQYLATLLLPPDAYAPRRILVPFAGSGSEAIGAMLAGWDEIVGVEMIGEYVSIARARLRWWQDMAAGAMFNDVRQILQAAK